MWLCVGFQDYTPERKHKHNLIANLLNQESEPMAREPDVALLIMASGSLDIFLTRLLQMKLL